MYWLIKEHGILWSKEYHLKLATDYGKLKLMLPNFKEAQLTISSMVKTR
jgi:hypothetical protein